MRTHKTVSECLEDLGVNLTAEAVIEHDGPYIGVETNREGEGKQAMWIVLVSEGQMHDVEVLLGTRR